MLAQGATGVRRYGARGERRLRRPGGLRALLRPAAPDAGLRRDRLRRRGGQGRQVPRLPRDRLRRPARSSPRPSASRRPTRWSSKWPHDYLSPSRAVDERTVICVLTHDPKFDVPLLEVALRTAAGYVGAMGSRRTHEDRLARLREAGLTEAELARLRSPIGLDLGARTPEETAVSIAAELIQLRWGGSGPAADRRPGPHPRARAPRVITMAGRSRGVNEIGSAGLLLAAGSGSPARHAQGTGGVPGRAAGRPGRAAAGGRRLPSRGGRARRRHRCRCAGR